MATSHTKEQQKAFEALVRDNRLTGAQRNEGWRRFREQGYDAASAFVNDLLASLPSPEEPIRLKTAPIPYRIWGREHIEAGALGQMETAMRLPVAVAGALMPDAHLGYGLPIGGVLAVENAVIPYAVGVDIACRMMMTIYPDDPSMLDDEQSRDYGRLKRALLERTIFGSGGDGLHDGIYEHPVLDASCWQATDLLRDLRKTAIRQIGTSGTGNHFVEWGRVRVTMPDNPLNVPPGEYLALLSHSGSRGVGYKIADFYSRLAMAQMHRLDETARHLAWLEMDSAGGQEYWEAMNLAGDFASANHHIIHEQVAKAAGLTPLAALENHHNFAWKETVEVEGEGTRELIVHRKGATPAGKGILGVIPGTMADPGYVVLGKGLPASINSASHGGGRQMSRTQAKKTVTRDELRKYLKARGVSLLGGGLDEAPQAYKRIEDVIGAQRDLVDIVGEFQPRLVRMADDSPPWKRKAAPADIVDAEGD